MMQRKKRRLLAVLALGFASAGWAGCKAVNTSDAAPPLDMRASLPLDADVVARDQSPDARAQAREYIGYYRSIKLTPEQENVKAKALSAIPAPCCRDYSVATCCCPCNLAKAVWGLSHYLIARKGYGSEQVSTAVREWLASTNATGYTGDACYTGGCERSFDQNGCGGMDEQKVV